MALIGRIRERSGLVLILIAVAVAGFIIMDMTSAGPSGSKISLFNNPNNLGKVNGSVIKKNELDATRDALYGRGNELSTNKSVWDYFVEKALVEKATNTLGMSVSKDELLDAMFSLDPSHISPALQNLFGNPQTGQIDIQQLQQVKQAGESGQLNPEFLPRWAEQEKAVVKERLQTKLLNFVQKGIYTPKWMAEAVYNDQNTKTDFTFVRLPFTAVQDSEVQLTDADYQKYIDDNRSFYYRDREGRKINYATFAILPSGADSAKARKIVGDRVAEFRAAKSDSSFVLSNGGIMAKTFFTKAALGAGADSLMSKPVGSVVGPYVNGGSYNVSRIIARQTIADSVKARHILFKDQTPKFVDSVLALLKVGKVSWDSLNTKYSADDVSKMKGGDLGYFAAGMMVPEFNDLCFYEAEQGKFYKVTTSFGNHIIQVTGKKVIKNEQGVRLATISEAIIPSTETVQNLRDKANGFLQRNADIASLKKDLEKIGMNLETSQPLEKADYMIGSLGGNNGTRSMVKWANTAKVGQIAKEIFEIQDQNQGLNGTKLAIASLKSVLPAGMPSVADVKEEITDIVKSRKKGEILKGKVAGNKDISALASQYQSKLDTAKAVALASNFVPNLGQEPKVLGNAFKLNQGDISEPIVGSGGVYVLNILSKTAAVAPTDVTQIKNQTMQSARGMVRGRYINGLRNKSKYEDNRLD